MKKVLIIEKSIKFYRKSFYERLRSKCLENRIELVVIYGEDDSLNFNDIDLEWGIKIKNHFFNFFSKRLIYQNVWKYVKDADLIIVDQANKFIVNYILWMLNILKIKKLAFWGHGINFQNDNSILSKISEYLKKLLARRVHRFFAYTDLSKEILIKSGLKPDRITVVNNTIDVENLKNEINKYNTRDLEKVRNEIGLKGENVCCYIGGMYKEKRLDFLLDAIKIVKQSIKDFEMIFIGDGPDRNKVVEFKNDNDWVYYLGVKNDVEKVPYLLISKLLLMPGLVGLVIIDTFLFQLPLITTDCNLHSPEICYLENGINGVMTFDDVDEYSKKVIDLLENERELLKLKEGCRNSVNKYSMENMINNFFNGIVISL